MHNPDVGKINLSKIITEFEGFCAKHGKITEADTRANLIDKICKDVLGWPESDIVRESHTESGYMDYCLVVNGKKYVTVEAKKEGYPFTAPITITHKRLKLNGAILTDVHIREAINQVRTYCDDSGIRYAIATNGYCWIIFRAIREDMPWREGNAVVFKSLDFISENFTDFWNLISYEAIISGQLDSEFGSQFRPKRELHRVLNHLLNPDVPLLRNSYHAQLYPIILNFFEDIASSQNVETLKSCYVYSESLKIVASDINTVIVDSIPKFLASEGTEQVVTSKVTSGKFGVAVKTAFQRNRGQLFLLLGGIGSGKSTFLKRYQRTDGIKTLERSLWFNVDFLKSPIDPAEMEKFVWESILGQLRTNYQSPNLETRANIKSIFEKEIKVLRETALNSYKPDSMEYELALSPFLTQLSSDLSEYVPRILSTAKPKKGLNIVLFIDNVDQLSPFYQSQIFLLAQRITDKINSITIVALREESYYTASIKKVFTAYTDRKFHIASPPFRRMIDQRIRYVLKLMEVSDQLDQLKINIPFDKSAIADFLTIVELSIFEQNKNIARLIEALCFGNMRLALQMFSTFLQSGATDVDKMLRIYRRDGSYFVAFHEFVKSIMLGDRYYYKESQSYVMNLFNCGTENNSSHFTPIRLLRMLNLHRSESNEEGQGYVDIGRVVMSFEEIFNNREDLIRCLNSLVARQLVEVNTRSIENISGATHVRITSSGWYYSRYLAHEFSYLDLVLQDTPINNLMTAKELASSVHKVNNLGDKDEEKLERMEERFRRVDKFIKYLEEEEQTEVRQYTLSVLNLPIAKPIMNDLKTRYITQRDWIRNRLSQNRERFADEFSFVEGEEFEKMMKTWLEKPEEEDSDESKTHST